MPRIPVLFRCGAVLFAALCCGAAQAADPIVLGFVDGLSGSFANVGEAGLRHLQIAVEDVNARGGVLGGRKFEVLSFDTKSSAQEAQLVFKQAVDRGVRYIFQGNGSNVALALSEAVAKNNARDPGQAVLFMNFAAVDPALTNERCNFWHFRLDADSDMKMQAVTNYIARQPGVRKIYLINQDYSFGQSVARTARAMLLAKRPDIQVVGDDLHPMGKVKDFAPYVAKIKASGADTVITGNWGNDINLLVKAGRDAGLAVDYYTYYAGGFGAVSVLGEAGVNHTKQVTIWHPNIGGRGAAEHFQAYRKRFPEGREDLYYAAIRHGVELLAAAIERARSTEPLAVARALEGLRIDQDAGELYVRADNHQVIQPIFLSTLVKANGKDVRFDAEKTGFGFRTDARVEGRDTLLPTACKMQRP